MKEAIALCIFKW